MELLQLRYFLRSAITENFSTTAAEYRVPASAVSASVKKLEQELGVKLFIRSANKIKVSETGREFAQTVSRALALIDSQILKMQEEKQELSGDIYLLVRSERSFVTDKIRDFRNKYPLSAFHLIHDYNDSDYSKYDIIIDEGSSSYGGFIQKPLISEKIKLAASAKSPLAGKSLYLQELKDMPFITMSKKSSLYRITEESCLKAGFRPKIAIESDDPYYIRRYIEEDFGIAFFPEASWQNDKDKIVFLDVLDFDYSRTTYAYLNSVNSGKAVKSFFEHL